MDRFPPGALNVPGVHFWCIPYGMAHDFQVKMHNSSFGFHESIIACCNFTATAQTEMEKLLKTCETGCETLDG